MDFLKHIFRRSRTSTATKGSEADQKLLEEYISCFKSRPKPTSTQMWAFARRVSNAHSWYKGTSFLPPGQPFWFFCDPGAGMDRYRNRDGSLQVTERPVTNTNSIGEVDGYFGAVSTARYGELYGCLSFAWHSRPLPVLSNYQGPLPGNAQTRAFYHPGSKRLSPIPAKVLKLGGAFASSIVH